MVITFFSSVLNHHQQPFCDAIRKQPGVQFYFVQMGELEIQRQRLGYTAVDESYVIKAKEEPQEAYRLCMESDVVIAGVIHQDWVNKRVAQNKLTFVYKERFLKKSPLVALSPAFIKNGYWNYFRFRNKNLYFLCASSYTAKDTAIIFPRKNKKFCWGYFPMQDDIDWEEIRAAKKGNKILCVGRLIDWKRIDTAIKAIYLLQKRGLRLELDIVGEGPTEFKLKELAVRLGIDKQVHFLGALPPSQVRNCMKEAEIFVFPSNKKEGWGAVLNEAMSMGCACVASKQAGSSAYLIKHKENGFLFTSGNVKQLASRIEEFLSDLDSCRMIQKKAYDTIKNQWNEQIASERFCLICNAILTNNPLPQFEDGPMSLA